MNATLDATEAAAEYNAMRARGLIGIAQVVHRCGFAEIEINALLAVDRFPEPHAKANGRSYWKPAQIDEWIRSLPRRQIAGETTR